MHRCESLFAPLMIGTLEMKNRIAMAPMATDFAEGDGTVSDRMVDYYEARARGGAGLIILEVCSVDGTFPYIPRTLGLWDDAFIPGLRRLVDAVHAHGARVIPQVAHPGPESLSPLFNGTQTVGPVAGIVNGLTRMRCRELGGDEIPGVVARFGDAARRAREAGFDGIELHAAHAYMLLGSFLSALRNRRTDGYGGDLAGRCRFPLEVLRAIREAAGEDFPVTMRISADEPVPGGRGILETEYLASLFARAGVAAFHVSGGVYPDLAWRVIPPTGTPHCINAEGAGRIRRAAGVPVMAVGRILEPALADRLIERGDADVAVLGRALLADPDWPAKAESGAWEDIAPCVGCGLGCVRNREMGGDMTCIVNPAVGREREMTIRPAERKKRVMIAGGGPAGLECARVAALAGHDVTLYEREPGPGGQFNLAAAAPGKQELGKVIRYLARQAERAGAVMRMGVEVTRELLKSERPDALVVATGARPRRPDIPGAEGANVSTAWDVIGGAVDLPAGRVLVVGGGMTGCETALALATAGEGSCSGVTILEMTEDPASDMYACARELLLEELRRREVRLVPSVTAKEITPDGALVTGPLGEERISGMDHVVIAAGSEPLDELSTAAGDSLEVHVIGDAAEPRRVLDAIREGSETGRKL